MRYSLDRAKVGLHLTTSCTVCRRPTTCAMTLVRVGYFLCNITTAKLLRSLGLCRLGQPRGHLLCLSLIITNDTMFGGLLELLLATYGLVEQLHILYLRKTNHITHHGRSLHITPDTPLLSYALARGPPLRSSFCHQRTDRRGQAYIEDVCSTNILAHITNEDCMSEGCIDTVWIWEGVAHHEDGKYNFHSKETLRLWDLWEKVTGESVDSKGWARCRGKDPVGSKITRREDQQVELGIKDEL